MVTANNSTSLSAEARRELILRQLTRDGFASVRTLQDHLGVSDMTVRRDLKRLQSEGSVKVVHGGASLPSRRVQVNGTPMVLMHTCATAACKGGELYVLVDPAAHALHGLLIEDSGTAGASVQQLTWLGKPTAAVQAFLKQQLAD